MNDEIEYFCGNKTFGFAEGVSIVGSLKSSTDQDEHEETDADVSRILCKILPVDPPAYHRALEKLWIHHTRVLNNRERRRAWGPAWNRSLRGYAR